MSNTPPAPKVPPGGKVIQMPKKSSEGREATIEFDPSSGKPKSRTEIVVGTREPTDAPRTERVTIPDDPKTQRHELVPARGLLDHANLPERTFEFKERLAEYEQPVQVAYVILEGHVSVYELDKDGNPSEEPAYSLSKGEIVNRSLFDKDADLLLDSSVRIVAQTRVRTLVLTPDDLVGPTAREVERRARVRYVLDLLVTRLDALERLERDFYGALDAERAKRDELNQKIVTLQAENAHLDKVNRSLVLGAVGEAVRKRLNELTAENRELNTDIRGLRKKNEELEATSRSQMNYVASVTEEVKELERLQDLLGLESDDPARLIEELRRVFLNLYQLKNPRLQNLGVLGLGELGKLGNNELLPDIDRDLSEDEIDQGISEIPPDPGLTDPTKNAPKGA